VPIKSDTPTLIRSRVADAWPGTTLMAEPTPLTGGFWASMYRLRLEGQPVSVPADVVLRIAPDAAMGAKELAVQHAIADQGFATPRVRLTGPVDDELGGIWSITDFATGNSPLGDLNGIGALRRAPRLPRQLAEPMAALHALDPEPVTSAVATNAPTVAWTVGHLLEHFETASDVLHRPDLVAAVRSLAERRPPEGSTVICHGDLHPFNLLVDDAGHVTVIDWTAAIRAEPAYDVAFTSMLVANPPLTAPGPLGAVIGWVGQRLAGRFVARYREAAPGHDLTSLDWYRALRSARILIEAATIEARRGSAGAHPFQTLVPAATLMLSSVAGTRIRNLNRPGFDGCSSSWVPGTGSGPGSGSGSGTLRLARRQR
jgi:aminoglycoside phosphotransferase (APT) family kinase protein